MGHHRIRETIWMSKQMSVIEWTKILQEFPSKEMCIIVSDIAYFSSYEVNIDLSWEKNPWRNERTKNVETASLKTMWSAQSFNKVSAFTCTLQSKACQKTSQNDYCKISLIMHYYLSVAISYDILYNFSCLLEMIVS